MLQERGNQITLTEFEGIDILGNMIESSSISPNRDFYGDLHNMGHVFLSYIHDPDHRHLVSYNSRECQKLAEFVKLYFI